ncbi:hypothetical protein Tco_0950941 [Tanacetum coccineum]|uniref:Uncharacterized protein n=1 Tax=Tanacetum coccineum TaxID=301880 RepID=A0ABQ5DVD2_9ASTR
MSKRVCFGDFLWKKYITKQVQGRQTQSFAGTGNKGIATTSRGNYAAGQVKVVKCYNCLGKGTWRNNCDDISSAKAVLMANLLRCDSDVLSEELQDAGIQDINSSSPNDLLVLSLVEQMTDHVAPLRVAKLEKDVSELNKIDLPAKALATLKSQVPNVVDEYLRSKLGVALQKTIQKHSADSIHTHSVKPDPESNKIQTPTVNLKQGSEKSA